MTAYLLSFVRKDRTFHNSSLVCPDLGQIELPNCDPAKGTSPWLYGFLDGCGWQNYGEAGRPFDNFAISHNDMHNGMWAVLKVRESDIVFTQISLVKVPSAEVLFLGSAPDAVTHLEHVAPHTKNMPVLFSTRIAHGKRLASAGYGGSAISGKGGQAISGCYGASFSEDNGSSVTGNGGVSTSGSYGFSVSRGFGRAFSGYCGNSIVEYEGIAVSGSFGNSTAGIGGTAISGEKGSSTAGYTGKVMSGRGGFLVLYCSNNRIFTAHVGEGEIKPNIFYKMNDDESAMVETD